MKRTTLAVLAAGIFALVSSYAADAEPAAGKPVLIGAHLDEAKQASYYSLLQKDSINLFVKEFNAAGGIDGRPVQVLFEDDENNPVITATKVDKFASAGVDYIISIGSSATGLATQARASELKIPDGAPACRATDNRSAQALLLPHPAARKVRAWGGSAVHAQEIRCA
jgi:branched-chain amino acid transport system substrate-binding protein